MNIWELDWMHIRGVDESTQPPQQGIGATRLVGWLGLGVCLVCLVLFPFIMVIR